MKPIKTEASPTPTLNEVLTELSGVLHRIPRAHRDIIIRTINAHEELLDACKAAVDSEWIDINGLRLPVVMGELRAQIKQAIARAEGQP